MPNALITGANRGIGLELCRQLSQRSYAVTALCRQASPALKALPVNIREDFDVSDEQGVNSYARELEVNSIDLLINNAGIWRDESLENMNLATIREQMEVNAIAPLHISQSLLSSFRKGAKIIMITSQMASIADNTSGDRYGYRMSKTALNMATSCLAVDLKPREIAVACIHPGYVSTDMTNHMGPIAPAEAVQGILSWVDKLNLENSGSFWHANGDSLPW